MKTFYAIEVSRSLVGDAAFDAVSAIHPEGAVFSSFFDARFESGDSRIAAILDVLSSSGAAPITDPFATVPSGGFSLAEIHEYEEKEVASAEYFNFVANDYFRSRWEAVADSGPQAVIARNVLRPASLMAATGVHVPHVVSSRFRQLLEEAGMIGCAFLPTLVCTNDSDWDETLVDWDNVRDSDPFWELSSTVELPPMSSTLKLHALATEEQVPAGYKEGGIRIVPDTRGYAMRYDRDALRDFEPFDVALSAESFSPYGDSLGRRIVVSQKFRDLCMAHQILGTWSPVFVDE